MPSLRALVAKRDFNEIEEISKQRKSPIGWEVSTTHLNPSLFLLLPAPFLCQTETNVHSQPFYNLTLQAGNPRLAAVFIPKCTGLEPGEAITMYEKCGLRVKAAEEAVKIKDSESWQRLWEAAGRTSTEGREIERLGAAVFKK